MPPDAVFPCRYPRARRTHLADSRKKDIDHALDPPRPILGPESNVEDAVPQALQIAPVGFGEIEDVAQRRQLGRQSGIVDEVEFTAVPASGFVVLGQMSPINYEKEHTRVA